MNKIDRDALGSVLAKIEAAEPKLLEALVGNK
jgi:hypothetical protein